jgi:hypothetical protein
MPAEPYTEEGLRRAEQAALDYYWADDPMDLEWKKREPRFARFLGEVFVRNVEGAWMWIDVTGKGHTPVVSEPAVPLYLEVGKQLRNALSKRTGDRWAFVFRNSAERYEEWKAAGRLPPKEWLDYRVQEKLARYT